MIKIRNNDRSIFWFSVNIIYSICFPFLIFCVMPQAQLWLKTFSVIICSGFLIGGLWHLIESNFLKYVKICISSLLILSGIIILCGLFMSALYLKNIYGDFGKGASSIFWAMIALFLPYLIAIPAIELKQITKKQ